MKRAARGSLKIQDAKNCQKFAVFAPSHTFVGCIFATGTYQQSEKLAKQQYFPLMSSQGGELRPTAHYRLTQ